MAVFASVKSWREADTEVKRANVPSIACRIDGSAALLQLELQDGGGQNHDEGGGDCGGEENHESCFLLIAAECEWSVLCCWTSIISLARSQSGNRTQRVCES